MFKMNTPNKTVKTISIYKIKEKYKSLVFFFNEIRICFGF